MISLALALAVSPAATCQIDRQLPVGFEKWRYRTARLDFDRASAGDNQSGHALDSRDLPAARGRELTRFFQTGSGGTYAVAIDRDAPLVVYGDARGTDGKRLAIQPVAVRGGPACTSIAAVQFYRLPAGNYYARAEGLDGTGARTLVTRLD